MAGHFQVHTLPVASRYNRGVQFGLVGVAVILVTAFVYAMRAQDTPQQDTRSILRQETRPLELEAPKKIEPPPPPLPQPELPPPHVEVPAPQPPPPPAPREPDPNIARRREALLKAMEAKVLVEGFSPDKAQATTPVGTVPPMPNNGPRPFPTMPNPWQQPGQEIASNQPLSAGMGSTHQMWGESSFTQNGQYLAGGVQRARSPYQINAGTSIPVTLKQPITSDLEGQTSGLVSLTVFDSVTGQFPLIPQGSTVVGFYDTDLGPQARLNVAFQTLYFPNGCSLPLQGMPSADSEGYAGVTDVVNRHFFQRYGSVFGLAAITAAIGLAGNSNSNHYYNYSPAREATRGAGRVLGQAVEEDLRRAMNTPPTVTIRGGFPFNITVTQDIVFPKPYDQKEDCQ